MWVSRLRRATLTQPYVRHSQLKIADWGDRGEGIAVVKPENPLALSKRILIPGTIPGETVTVSTCKRDDGTLFGEIRLIDVVSPHRASRIACPHYETCGACSLMHVKYKHQLKVKQNFVATTVKLSGLQLDIPPCEPSPRSTVSLVVQEVVTRDRNRGKDSGEQRSLQLGYYHKVGSQNIAPISSCVVSAPAINQLIPGIKDALQDFPDLKDLRHVTIKATRTPEVLVMLSSEGKKKSKRAEKREMKKLKRSPQENIETLSGEDKQERLKDFARRIGALSQNIVGVFGRVGTSWELLSGERTSIMENVCGMNFRLSPASFFQTNIVQAEKIYSRVMSHITIADKVIEAYSGVGVLTCLIATRAMEVVGIESVEEAVNDARENAANNKLEGRANFICGEAEKVLRELMSQKTHNKKTSVVVLNPPRTGVHELLLDCLGEFQPNKILYISCNPESLARDISILQSMAHYEVEVELFDMFPHTMHCEVLAILQLKKR